MRILHTESSNGWGGQEMRILNESLGMRARGYEVWMAVTRGGALVKRARAEGFTVFELDFVRAKAPLIVMQLVKLIKEHQIDLVNTHSSLDAWIGGIAARASSKQVVRTRHLSAPIRKGLNSRLLYNTLADCVVTTSSAIIPTIVKQAGLPSGRCKLVATGVAPEKLCPDPQKVASFRKKVGVGDGGCLVGTACVVRSWKGVADLIDAAHLLRDIKQLKWVIIGGGYLEPMREHVERLKLEETVIFTEHLDDPSVAIDALDIFALLSTANEGISQASLQAAYMEKPLVTTTVGGLPEVCKQGKTGVLVPPRSPRAVADAVMQLCSDSEKRSMMGKEAHALVEEKFTMRHTLDQMELVYQELCR